MVSQVRTKMSMKGLVRLGMIHTLFSQSQEAERDVKRSSRHNEKREGVVTCRATHPSKHMLSTCQCTDTRAHPHHNQPRPSESNIGV